MRRQPPVDVGAWSDDLNLDSSIWVEGVIMLMLGYRATLEALTVDGIVVLALATLVLGAIVGGFVGIMIGFRIGQRDGRRAAELHHREHWVDLLEDSVTRRSDRQDRRREDRLRDHRPQTRRPQTRRPQTRRAGPTQRDRTDDDIRAVVVRGEAAMPVHRCAGSPTVLDETLCRVPHPRARQRQGVRCVSA